MSRDREEGLTLIEVLVTLALIGIVMAALFNYFAQSSTVATQASGRAELQQEVLNAQQLIAGKVKEAWYVYPVGATITLTNTSLTRTPSGGATWTVGTDPILALILPPETTGGAYRFLAYYPVRRADWVAGTSTETWRNPGSDADNGSTWILAEYRGTLAGSVSGFNPTSTTAFTPPAAPTGITPNILSDYVAPTTMTSGFTTTSNTYTMFQFSGAVTGPTSTTNPVTGVTVNLATTRKTIGTTLRLPNATDEYSMTVYPLNLGKVAAN